jgi:hypothetical protein
MKWNGRAGMNLLIVCACLSAAWQLGCIALTRNHAEQWSDLVVGYDEQRFAGVAALLPPGGVVGYVEDDPPDSAMTQHYYLTQYVLAPCVLVNDSRRAVVLVDGRPEAEVRPPMAGGRMLRDLGNGVRLFGHEEP